MKSISKMKKQAVALSLVLALGLVLSVSTGPVYGSPTVSIGTGVVTQDEFARSWLEKAVKVVGYVTAAYQVYKWLFGVAAPTAQATYPSNALDR